MAARVKRGGPFYGYRKKHQINLLPREAFAASAAGRTLVWLLSTFRIIVIVTEIIVLLAFLSRFFLDTQNTDLNELIAQKQAVVAAASNFEKDFKDVQSRVEIFSEFASEEDLATTTIEAITANLPREIFLNSLALTEKNIRLEGASPTERGIQQFVVNLQANANFDEVTVLQAESSPNQSLINFTISLVQKTLKEQE